MEEELGRGEGGGGDVLPIANRVKQIRILKYLLQMSFLGIPNFELSKGTYTYLLFTISILPSPCE